MDKEKIWFKAYNSRLWVPVSVEGWVATGVFFLLLFVIAKAHKISGDAPFVLSQHWPVVVEYILLSALFYYVTKGHVEKKY